MSHLLINPLKKTRPKDHRFTLDQQQIEIADPRRLGRPVDDRSQHGDDFRPSPAAIKRRKLVSAEEWAKSEIDALTGQRLNELFESEPRRRRLDGVRAESQNAHLDFV